MTVAAPKGTSKGAVVAGGGTGVQTVAVTVDESGMRVDRFL